MSRKKKTGSDFSMRACKRSMHFYSIKIPLLCWGLLFFFCNFLIAKPSSEYKISISTTNLAFDDPLQIRIDYNNKKKHLINWDTKDFQINPHPSISEQTTLINGSMSFKRTHTYIAYPNKKGQLSLKFNIDNNEHFYTIHVSDTKKMKVSKLEDVFITNLISRKKVYLNQILTLETVIYYRVNINNTFLSSDFDLSAFIETENIAAQKSETVIINGQRYNKQTLFKKVIYPIRTSDTTDDGKHHLGSIVLQVEVPKKTGGQFFNFFSYQTIKVTGNPIAVQVVNFPANDKPQKFQNNVGDFDLQLISSTNAGRQFEPFIVKLRITGAGNLKALSLPNLVDVFKDQNDFLVRQNPGLKENLKFQNDTYQGSVEQEYYFIPQKYGKVNFNKVTLSFFNFKDRKYHVLQKGLPTLNIQKVESSAKTTSEKNSFAQNHDPKNKTSPNNNQSNLKYLFTDISSSRDTLLLIWLALHPVSILFILFFIIGDLIKKQKNNVPEHLTSKKVIEKLKKLQNTKINTKEILPVALEILYQHITDELKISPKQTIRQIEKHLIQENIRNPHCHYCVTLIKKYQKLLYLEKKNISHQSEVAKIISYFKSKPYEKK